jgi:hypothetical protein
VAFLEAAWYPVSAKIAGIWMPAASAAITSITALLASGPNFGAAKASLYGIA